MERHASSELITLLAGPSPTPADRARARRQVYRCIDRYEKGDRGAATREGIGEYSLLSPTRMLDMIVVDLRHPVPGRSRHELILAMTVAEALSIWTAGKAR